MKFATANMKQVVVGLFHVRKHNSFRVGVQHTKNVKIYMNHILYKSLYHMLVNERNTSCSRPISYLENNLFRVRVQHSKNDKMCTNHII